MERMVELVEQPYSDQDAEWDAFVAAHPQGSLLQTTHWGRLKGRFGWEARRVWLRQNGQLVAGGQLLVRSMAFGAVKIGYMPHGPLVNWQDKAQIAVLFHQIDQAIYEQRASLLKIEPLLWQGEDMTPAGWQTICADQQLLADSDTIQPPRTILVDLRPAESDILAAMKQKTRYNIRLAEKKGVTVRQGGLKDMSLFNQLMAVTGRRDNFGVHDPRYYRAALELFAPQQAALFIAEFEQKPLAAVMVFKSGPVAAYLYGASSDEERQRMPTYAVQWAAMCWAKSQGCSFYDLWGVPDEEEASLEAAFEERHDGLWGVYRFKRGFGGQIKRTVGCADRVYNRLFYRLYKWRRGR